MGPLSDQSCACPLHLRPFLNPGPGLAQEAGSWEGRAKLGEGAGLLNPFLTQH